MVICDGRTSDHVAQWEEAAFRWLTDEVMAPDELHSEKLEGVRSRV